MSYHFRDSYDPYEEMRAFYRLDDPTEEEQFNFVESLEYLIETASSPVDKEAYDFIDLYDLMTFDSPTAIITFSYNEMSYQLDIFPKDGETIYQFNDKWYHGADDFLEKARIITSGSRPFSTWSRISECSIE